MDAAKVKVKVLKGAAAEHLDVRVFLSGLKVKVESGHVSQQMHRSQLPSAVAGKETARQAKLSTEHEGGIM